MSGKNVAVKLKEAAESLFALAEARANQLKSTADRMREMIVVAKAKDEILEDHFKQRKEAWDKLVKKYGE